MSLTEKTRQKAKVKALDFLHKKNYDFVCRVARGTFSTIVAIKTPTEQSLLASKVVAADDTWPGELELWGNFKHDNIVQLFDVIMLPASNVFFMELCMTSLRNIFLQNEFCSARTSFTWTKFWIRDVATGLFYLHSQQLCHLNLQPSNIFIKMNREAAIGDFGCINSTTRSVNHYGLPKQYSPPECWMELPDKNHPYIGGIPYDLWSLGMMAFNVWTGHTLENRICCLDKWKVDFYPHMYVSLRIEKFTKRISLIFPNADLKNRDMRDALNFIRGLLRENPLERPDISMILEHALLSCSNVMSLFISDFIWMFYQEERSDESVSPEVMTGSSAVETNKVDETEDFRKRPNNTNKISGIKDWWREKLK